MRSTPGKREFLDINPSTLTLDYLLPLPAMFTDIVLLSAEQESFPASSLSLRIASGFFRALFGLPQPSGSLTEPPAAIPTYEPSAVLRPILQLVHGLPPPHRLTNLDEISGILDLADRWECPGVLSYIRPILSTPSLLTPANALRLYAIACHYNWAEEARLAAHQTFGLDLYEHEDAVQDLSAKDFMALLRLHRARRDGFRRLLDDPQRFTAGNVNPFHCGVCSSAIDNSSWRMLKIIFFERMDAAPTTAPFETFMAVEGGFDEELRDAAEACWTATCPRSTCASLNYDRKATMKQISSCGIHMEDTVGLDWEPSDI